jgi:hypothetical protein
MTSSQTSHLILESSEVWKFLREHNIVRVFPPTEARAISFMTIEKDILKPRDFFERFFHSIRNRLRENHEKWIDVRYKAPAWEITYNSPVKRRPTFRIKDQRLEDSLDKEWDELSDLSRAWRKLEKLVELGEEEIPLDLLPKRAQPKGRGSNGRLKLSGKDREELNGQIFRVVENYLDSSHLLEEAIRLTAENSPKHFEKWLEKAGVKRLTKGMVEGRYKRYQKD